MTQAAPARTLGMSAVRLNELVRYAAGRTAASLRNRIPCVYLALAEREGASIATADDRLGRLARNRGVAVFQVSHG